MTVPECPKAIRFTGSRAMAPQLVGAHVTRVVLQGRDRPLFRNQIVSSVHAQGKHLLIQITDLYVRTHLGIHGSWHGYPPRQRWKRPASRASLVIETRGRTFVCFDAREVDYIPASRLGLHRPLRRLGPDLLSDEVDFHAILKRVRQADPSALVANVLLDQTLASGIGNVYKSEVLFLCWQAPSTPIGRLRDSEILELYRTARDQLHANVERARRTTTGREAQRLWVYGRAHRPCLRCTTTISFARLGRARSTYWCGSCQPVRLITELRVANRC